MRIEADRLLEALPNIPQPGEVYIAKKIKALSFALKACTLCQKRDCVNSQIIDNAPTNVAESPPAPAPAPVNTNKTVKNVQIVNNVKVDREMIYDKIVLFKYPLTISQSTLDQRQEGSNACTLIASIFATDFIKHCNVHIRKSSSILPFLISNKIKQAIRKGNALHDINFNPTDLLSSDEVSQVLCTEIAPMYHTNICTNFNVPLNTRYVMELQNNQFILMIKNGKAVSIMPCNNNTGILIFDSHIHPPSGSYLFYCDKTENCVNVLFQAYDEMCDPYPRKDADITVFETKDKN